MYYLRLAFSIAMVGFGSALLAADWAVTPAPTLGKDPEKKPAIIVGRGTRVRAGFTFKIAEGEKVDLRAVAADSDTRTSGTSVSQIPEKTELNELVWSSSHGTIEPIRSRSTQDTVFKAPKLGKNQESIAVTISVRPDDRWTGAQTGIPDDQNPAIPPTDTGNRNDDPGEELSITIEVVKEFPTTIKIAENCSFADFANTFWAKGERIGGQLMTHLEVGPAPAAGKSWDRHFVREHTKLVTLDGDATTDDFSKNIYRDSFVGRSTVQGFIVGHATNERLGCTCPATPNQFCDTHLVGPAKQNVYLAATAKKVHFEHQYSCGKALLTIENGGDTYLDALLFNPTTFNGISVTEVIITKVPK